MLKTEVNTVFIVLCYRETRDVVNLINSINNFGENIGIIIVNSYYDELTKNELNRISKEYGCLFLNVENRGYGYGNNRGVELANEKFIYNFLCICNPDIIFSCSPFSLLTEDKLGGIIAPNIVTLKRKKQNPYFYFQLSIIDHLKYFGLAKNLKILYFFAVGINKVFRYLLDMLVDKSEIRIYACHGSCLFIGTKAMEKIDTLYNEKMFLFHEEEHLARVARDLSIPILFLKDISVTHLEDRSSEDIKDSTFLHMKQSYSEYYKYWKNRQGNRVRN